MRTKGFSSKSQAYAFAKDVKGFVEGPFNDTFVVFFKGRRHK